MAKLSIQYYTLREESQKDFEGGLKFCAEQGFSGIEFAGYYGHTKEEVKGWLDQYGLVATSAHVPFQEMEEDLQKVMDFQRYLGNNRIAVPFYMAVDEASTNELIEKLIPIAKTLDDNGFVLYYHNHDHELKEYGGKCILDHLLDAIPTLKLEVDTFWVYAAGKNPVAFLEAHKNRMVGIVHIKDGFDGTNCTDEQKAMLPPEAFSRMKEHGIKMCPCSIGLGTAPVKDVIAKCKELGFEWLVLENDFPHPTGYEDVARSAKVLRELVD